MLQTLPDHHSHHYNVKTDITHAMHFGCRIYMCSLNIISQILCIQQDNLCCHMSQVTCTLMSISNGDIINTSQLSSLIHTKQFLLKKEPPKHAPITTVKDISFFIFEWLGKHLLTLHHIYVNSFAVHHILVNLQHHNRKNTICSFCFWHTCKCNLWMRS